MWLVTQSACSSAHTSENARKVCFLSEGRKIAVFFLSESLFFFEGETWFFFRKRAKGTFFVNVWVCFRQF